MQLSPRLITGVVSFCLVLTGLFVANMYLTMMIGEINRKRQENGLLSYLGFSFPKILRIFHEYRSAYPNGKMHVFALTAFTVAMLGLVGVAVCLCIVG